jgi:hypothetical protein
MSTSSGRTSRVVVDLTISPFSEPLKTVKVGMMRIDLGGDFWAGEDNAQSLA